MPSNNNRSGPSVWELTAIHVHLEGNALLFKSVSLQQDDKRSRFQPEAANITLEQAATSVMTQPKLFACSDSLNSGPASEEQAGCVEKLTSQHRAEALSSAALFQCALLLNGLRFQIGELLAAAWACCRRYPARVRTWYFCRSFPTSLTVMVRQPVLGLGCG